MLRNITKNPKVLIGTGIGLTASGFIYQTVFKFDKDIIVKEKYVKHDDDVTMYMITDSNNNIYKFENTMWRLHWKRAELWNHVDRDKKYRIKGVGIRAPLFGWYPRIYSVKKLD